MHSTLTPQQTLPLHNFFSNPLIFYKQVDAMDVKPSTDKASISSSENPVI